jgi:D-3-phosphoglycerate dehydrogenase
MARIQTFNKIAPEGLAILEDRGHTVGPEIDDPDAILVRSAKLHEIEFGPSLKAIARAGAGVNNVPVDRCTTEGIAVFNTPGSNANSVKELVVAGLMLSSRNIIGGTPGSSPLTPVRPT